MTELELWRAGAVALACGLLIGSERERGHAAGHIGMAGVRTFGLVSLAGMLTALLGTPAVLAGLGVIGLLVAVGYARADRDDVGATTEIALLLAFVLGALAGSHASLAAGTAVMATVLLASKERLHGFLRDTVRDTELEDALKFFVVAFVILPLLPSAPLGPYGVVNPRRVWTFVVAVTGIGWFGYLAVRILGRSRGLVVAGFAGGFVSGAATTAAMARKARDAAMRRPALAGAVAASVATLVELAAVTAVAAPAVTRQLAPALAGATVVLAVEALLLSRGLRKGTGQAAVADAGTTQQPDPGPAAGERPGGAGEDGGGGDGGDVEQAERPFALRPALILAAVLTVVLVVAKWGEDTFGSTGILVTAALAGFGDAHATSLAVSALAASGAVDVGTAVLAVGAALATNTVTKIVLAYAAGGAGTGWRIAALLVPPACVFAALLLLV